MSKLHVLNLLPVPPSLLLPLLLTLPLPLLSLLNLLPHPLILPGYHLGAPSYLVQLAFHSAHLQRVLLRLGFQLGLHFLGRDLACLRDLLLQTLSQHGDLRLVDLKELVLVCAFLVQGFEVPCVLLGSLNILGKN